MGKIGGLPQAWHQLWLVRWSGVSLPQLEDPFQVGEAGRRSDELGRVRRREQRLERRGLVAGAVEVERELAGPVGRGQRKPGVSLQRRGHGSVEPTPLGRQCGVVGDLADQRMPKLIGVSRPVHDQQSGVDRRANRGLSCRLIELDHGDQQLRIGLAADCGQRRKHVSARGVEACDVGLEEFRQEGGDRLAGEVRGHEFLGEERVALAAPHELVHQRRRRGDAQDGCGVHRHGVAFEPGEHDPLDAGHPAELGDTTAHARIASDLVGAVGAHEHNPLVDKVPGDVLEQVPRRGIAPVEIVEADDNGAVRSQFTDQLERQREHVAHTTCAGCCQLAQRLERVQLADVALSLNLTDQLDQRRDRDRVPADVHTATQIQPCASTTGRLEQQRRLADPSVTADQHDPRQTFGGSRHGTLKHRHLGVASHDRVHAVTACHRPRSIPGRCGLPSRGRPSCHVR